jgi:hypothetical protein
MQYIYSMLNTNYSVAKETKNVSGYKMVLFCSAVVIYGEPR